MDNQLINVLLIAGRDQVTDWLMTTLRAEAGVVLAGVVPSLERAAEVVEQRHVDVMLLDSSASDARSGDRLRAITTTPLSPGALVLVESSEMEFVQQAMLSGARGFLIKPFTQAQLSESMKRTFEIVLQQRALLAGSMAEVAPRAASADIFVLFSPKGGVGRTSLGTNLAIALHQSSRKPVTLIDADLRFGDVDIVMNAVARKSIADVLGYVNELEPALVESALVDHSSGIRLLLSPPYFDPALETDDGRLAHVIKMLAVSQGGYIVVDAPSGLDEATLNTLDIAQRVLLVTAASVGALRATKRFLELAAKLDYPPDKIKLVLNSHRKGADVPVEEIERHLGHPVAVSVPSDPLAVAVALNQGQPLVLRDRNHAVSKAVFKLAQLLEKDSGSDELVVQETPRTSIAASTNGRASSSMMRLMKPRQALGS